MTLPTRGFCHAVFLLAQSVRFRQRDGLEEWVRTARQMPTVMASALALEFVAKELLTLNLATNVRGISVSQKIHRCGYEASTDTFAGIAKCILECCPPPWLSIALVDGRLRTEFIPSESLDALSWLGDLLEPILIDVARRSVQGEVLRQKFGLMGELVVVGIEERLKHCIRHVSKISDAFGYDVESQHKNSILRIEVKSSLPETKDRVFLTRNEANKAVRFPSEWILRQVVMRPNVLVAEEIRTADVVAVREMDASKLLSYLPKEDGVFRWLGDAELRFPHDAWSELNFELAEDWCQPVI